MTLIYLLIIIISGILLGYLFIERQSFAERFSIGLGLGILVYSFGYFLLVKFGIPLSKNSVLTLIGSVLFTLGVLNCRNKNILDEIINTKLPNIKLMFVGEKRYLWLILTVLGGLILLVTLFWPISEWDALTLYDFRGRLYSQGLLFKDVQTLDSYDTYNAGYYFSYPPATSFMHASFYILGSEYPQVLYPLIFFALIIFFYKSLARYVSSNIALLFSVVFMLTNVFVSHASIPYTNLPYTYFYFISTILLIRSILEERNHKLLFLSGIFLAGASWMRSVEPFYLVNILILIYSVFAKKTQLISVVIYGAPVIFLRKLWSSVQSEYATKSFLTNINVNTILSNLIVTISATFKNALFAYYKFVGNNISIFLILILCTILLLIKKDRKYIDIDKWVLMIVYSNLLIIFIGVLAIGLLIPGRTEIYNSIDRFGIFLFPFIIFISGLSVKNMLGQNK